MPDKVSASHIQDFRIARLIGTDGKVHQVRGYSGWYFQASASTSQVDVNVSQQSELDPQFRGQWINPIDFWYNRPQPNPPVHNGNEFYGSDYLWRGLPEFEGHSFLYNALSNPVHGPGTNVDYIVARFPGPIRMSYLYGAKGQSGSNGPTINHTLRFTYKGGCKMQLHGRTPVIGDWSSAGSWIPEHESDRISIQPGQDQLILIDGLRGIRVRTIGWYAHFGDHVIKPEAYFQSVIYSSSGNTMVWQRPFSIPCEDKFFGDSTPEGSYTDPNNINSWVYGNSFELAGFHHWWIGDWIKNHPNAGIDRYNITATLKAWKTPPTSSNPVIPDPYKVVAESTTDLPPDAVVTTKAILRKTVHEFNPNHDQYGQECDPNYADSMGFIFTLPETLDNYAFGHIEWHYKGALIGSRFIQADSIGPAACLTGDKRVIWWKKTDSSVLGNYGGDLPVPPSERDPGMEGFPAQGESWGNDASLICMPYGSQQTGLLPTCGIWITSVGSTTLPYTVKPWTYLPRSNNPNFADGIQSVILDWGDGSSDACQIGVAIQHQYQAAGVYKVQMTVNYKDVDGRSPDRSATYVTVS